MKIVVISLERAVERRRRVGCRTAGARPGVRAARRRGRAKHPARVRSPDRQGRLPPRRAPHPHGFHRELAHPATGVPGHGGERAGDGGRIRGRRGLLAGLAGRFSTRWRPRTSRSTSCFCTAGPRRPFVPHAELGTGHRLGWVRWSHFGSQGYVITRDAARRFLEKNPLVRTGIDRALARYWHHGLTTYCLRPPVVSHRREKEGNPSLIREAPVTEWSDPAWRVRRRLVLYQGRRAQEDCVRWTRGPIPRVAEGYDTGCPASARLSVVFDERQKPLVKKPG